MLLYLIGVIIAFLTGILLILFPNALKRISEYLSMSVVNLDSFAYKCRHGIGVSLILAGACFMFFAYYEHAIKILETINR